MSFLSGLKVSNVEKTVGAAGKDKAFVARSKFVEALRLQVEAVDAAINKQEYSPTKTVKGVTKPRRFTPWFFKAVGVYYTYAKYGTGFLTINGGKSIEAGDKLTDLLSVYAALKNAADAGELDELLTKAASERGRRGKPAATADATKPANSKKK